MAEVAGFGLHHAESGHCECFVGAALRAFVEENSPTEDALNVGRQFSGVETKPRKISLIATSFQYLPIG